MSSKPVQPTPSVHPFAPSGLPPDWRNINICGTCQLPQYLPDGVTVHPVHVWTAPEDDTKRIIGERDE